MKVLKVNLHIKGDHITGDILIVDEKETPQITKQAIYVKEEPDESVKDIKPLTERQREFLQKRGYDNLALARMSIQDASIEIQRVIDRESKKVGFPYAIQNGNGKGKKICKVLDCNKPAKSKGMCMSHYGKWWRSKNV